jgi:deoxyribodipyrimidine photo-lyase
MRSLMWFREDLRIYDNTALYHAANNHQAGLIGLYIINSQMWQDHQTAACRIEFILRGLQQLSDDLQALNIPLLIISVKSTPEIPENILALLKEVKANAVFFNRQYEVNELKRDRDVCDFLSRYEIACHSYDDQTILLPTCVKTQKATSFKVFTAYMRAWYQVFLQQGKIKLLPKIKIQNPLAIKASTVPKKILGIYSTINPALWPAGEKEAKKRLNHFVKNKLFDYDKARDFPMLDGTSRLSPYLSSGMISPRECFMSAFAANQYELETGNKGAITWMKELIWREFYKTILRDTPRISMHRAYKPETDRIKWKFNQTLLDAWQEGRIGIPIIDAAMRQLNETGWMHNRLRMITAVFFVKNLFFDWRLGEKYFMNHLIDGDLAANNGGWQWCASTGVDAVPYFRIFNPIRQSERFDPQGDFIRHYCPELAGLNHRDIHKPTASFRIDLQASRDYAKEVFKSI